MSIDQPPGERQDAAQAALPLPAGVVDDARLNPGDVWIAAVLATDAGPDGAVMVDMKLLARRTGCPRREIAAHLRALVEAGYLQVSESDGTPWRMVTAVLPPEFDRRRRSVTTEEESAEAEGDVHQLVPVALDRDDPLTQAATRARQAFIAKRNELWPKEAGIGMAMPSVLESQARALLATGADGAMVDVSLFIAELNRQMLRRFQARQSAPHGFKAFRLSLANIQEPARAPVSRPSGSYDLSGRTVRPIAIRQDSPLSDAETADLEPWQKDVAAAGVPGAAIRSWIAPLRIERKDDVLYVAAPSAFHRDWVERDLKPVISQALRAHFSGFSRVMFTVSPSRDKGEAK